ncbi:MAG: hypothetical protein ACE5FH_02280 [Candidatus Zixiibacteriota bacterium]
MTVRSEVILDGFVQGLFGAHTDRHNPATSELPVSETRLQLRLAHFGNSAEFFGRLDFVWDGADSADYDWELRETYMKFRLGSKLDVKVGRQILTWGTGDLVFINDQFTKDYLSFFVGRDDQYLKAPQNALRVEYYNPLGDLAVVWTPRFEPNRLPTGRRLSYFNPIVGDITGEVDRFTFRTPEPLFRNGEVAARLRRQVNNFSLAAYYYHGFYKNPLGIESVVVAGDSLIAGVAVHPRLNVYGASARGATIGGVLWMEAGYYDSRDNPDGINGNLPNSSLRGLLGYERQLATNLTANLQWQLDYLQDYDSFKDNRSGDGVHLRGEVTQMVTSRVTSLLSSELLTVSLFMFYSPSERDFYIRPRVGYKHSDELTLAMGANLLGGDHDNTEFGQLRKNDNLFIKLTYGFQ